MNVKLDNYHGAWKNYTRDRWYSKRFRTFKRTGDKCGTTAVPAVEAEKGVLIRVCIEDPGRDGAPVLWVSPAHPPTAYARQVGEYCASVWCISEVCYWF